MEDIQLNNGVKMPAAGFGVFQIQDQTQCEQCVVDAVHAGYRLIDTAAVYGNEAAVGRAIQRCDISREELFLTSKLWVQDAGYEAAKKAIDNSLRNLQTDYLDLYLIHRPFGDYYGAWRAMEEAYGAGKIRAIGLSNFDSARVVDLALNNRITPAVDQVECHPFYQQEDTRRFLQEQGIVMEAWASFAEGKKQIFQNETLRQIGAQYGKSPAQVILRWNIQRGIVPLAKSVHRERMEQNLSVFDFTLSDKDMLAISGLDEGVTLFGRNDDPQYAKMINSVKIHGEQ